MLLLICCHLFLLLVLDIISFVGVTGGRGVGVAVGVGVVVVLTVRVARLFVIFFQSR